MGRSRQKVTDGVTEARAAVVPVVPVVVRARLRPVGCHGCQETFPVHPSSRVACPVCQKPPGVPCRGSGNDSHSYHVEREAAALVAGVGHRCPIRNDNPDADPLMVPCPSCGAGWGQGCRRPSEHQFSGGFGNFHAERQAAANRKLAEVLAAYGLERPGGPPAPAPPRPRAQKPVQGVLPGLDRR